MDAGCLIRGHPICAAVSLPSALRDILPHPPANHGSRGNPPQAFAAISVLPQLAPFHHVLTIDLIGAAARLHHSLLVHLIVGCMLASLPANWRVVDF